MILTFTTRLTITLLAVMGILTALTLIIGHSLPKQTIAYATVADYNLKPHLMDIRTGMIRKISDIPFGVCCPVWSPDGRQLAIISNNDRSYVVDVYTGRTRPLTPDTWQGWVVDWSPDGEKILVMGTGDAAYRYLYRIGADGSEPTRLTDAGLNIFQPSYSRDGRFIIFMGGEGADWDIYRMDTDTGDMHKLTGQTAYAFPSISPDSQRVAFYSQDTADTQLMVMDAEGGTPQPIMSTHRIGSTAVWSPDSQHIVLAIEPAPERATQIAVMDADGSNLRWLTDTALANVRPSWSPDGQHILYIAQTQGAKADIFMMEADGGNLRRLTNNNQTNIFFVWQP